ncbi:hypothetical protein G6F66_014500 [Rhizopus arrhizus]|nr:hypothetical protein G6F66_014500 [Rhizopus arrhizus]
MPFQRSGWLWQVDARIGALADQHHRQWCADRRLVALPIGQGVDHAIAGGAQLKLLQIDALHHLLGLCGIGGRLALGDILRAAAVHQLQPGLLGGTHAGFSVAGGGPCAVQLGRGDQALACQRLHPPVVGTGFHRLRA